MDDGLDMRAHRAPHELSEHAASVALTAMERGRLEHIARSIPPEHSVTAKPAVPAVGLRGRPLLHQWVLVVAAAETLGFAVPAVVGASTASSSTSVVVPALVAAGLVEGAALGTGQALVLRRALPGLSVLRWVLATAVGALLAYALGLLPAVVGGGLPRWAVIAGALVVGPLILATIGSMQWLVLRRHVDAAHRWILVTAVAWLVGLAVFLSVCTPLWQEGQSRVFAIGVGVVGGLLMAVVTASITGCGLVRLLSPGGRDS